MRGQQNQQQQFVQGVLSGNPRNVAFRDADDPSVLYVQENQPPSAPPQEQMIEMAEFDKNK